MGVREELERYALKRAAVRKAVRKAARLPGGSTPARVEKLRRRYLRRWS